MNNSNKPKKVIFTIMADWFNMYGFLLDDGDETRGIGSLHADDLGWIAYPPISDNLHCAFVEWQSLFAHDCESKLFDWGSFHKKGIELCILLKKELGDTVRVVYEKSFEDPNKNLNDRREILNNSRLKILRSREEIYGLDSDDLWEYQFLFDNELE